MMNAHVNTCPHILTKKRWRIKEETVAHQKEVGTLNSALFQNEALVAENRSLKSRVAELERQVSSGVIEVPRSVEAVAKPGAQYHHQMQSKDTKEALH